MLGVGLWNVSQESNNHLNESFNAFSLLYLINHNINGNPYFKYFVLGQSREESIAKYDFNINSLK